MSPELEKKLVEKYPLIFREYGQPPEKSCMAWGMAHDDGWFDLIDKLCADIMKMEGADNFSATQVKEKFGGLRFYFNGASDEMWKRVTRAEEESYTVCEVCGSKEEVTTAGPGWIRTLCKKCRNKSQ